MSAARREAVRGARKGARVARPSLVHRLAAYTSSHAQVLVESLRKLYRAPVSTIMTAAVIGIALALPTGLYVTLDNFRAVSADWDGAAQISVFLNMDVSDQRAAALAGELRARPGIASVEALSRDQAMAEFRELSGFGEALDVLARNPLPAVLVIRADKRHSDPETVEALVAALRAMPETDQAKLDLQWVKRLYAIMEIGQRAVLVIGGLLAVAVLLVVGNTIRLEIENRRDEIVITKLIGATNGFIRRPFLYSGMWYGLLGGAIAWLLLASALGLIAGPVRRLAGSYGSSFALSTLGPELVLALLGASTALGLAGSWLAVGRHLSAIEPT